MTLPVSVQNIFSKKFSEVREASGIGQERLAELLGLNERSIRNYESGHAFPRAKVLDRLCEIFDMEPSDWFPSRSMKQEYLDQKKALSLIRKGLEFLEASQTQEVDEEPSGDVFSEEIGPSSPDPSVEFGRGTRKRRKAESDSSDGAGA